jgi:hypothetical protein
VASQAATGPSASQCAYCQQGFLIAAVVFAGGFGDGFFGAGFFAVGFGLGTGGWKLMCILFLSPYRAGFPA